MSFWRRAREPSACDSRDTRLFRCRQPQHIIRRCGLSHCACRRSHLCLPKSCRTICSSRRQLPRPSRRLQARDSVAASPPPARALRPSLRLVAPCHLPTPHRSVLAAAPESEGFDWRILLYVSLRRYLPRQFPDRWLMPLTLVPPSGQWPAPAAAILNTLWPSLDVECANAERLGPTTRTKHPTLCTFLFAVVGRPWCSSRSSSSPSRVTRSRVTPCSCHLLRTLFLTLP